MRLTEFRLPYPVVEMGQSAGMAVGAGFSTASGGVLIESLELTDNGAVIAALSNGDRWVFTPTGYGKVAPAAQKGKAA